MRPLPAGLYLPAAHGMQTLLPEELVKTPAPLSAQSAPEPSPLAYFPGVQGVQVVAPVAELYVPGLQAAQEGNPRDEEVYVPAAQREHVAVDTPPVEEE